MVRTLSTNSDICSWQTGMNASFTNITGEWLNQQLASTFLSSSSVTANVSTVSNSPQVLLEGQKGDDSFGYFLRGKLGLRLADVFTGSKPKLTLSSVC